MCTEFLPRHSEDGCYKGCKEEVGFPLYPNPAIIFQEQGLQEGYSKTASFSFSKIHAEAPQYTMESPELRAPSNHSSLSGTSTGSSALNSPFSIQTPQYSMWTRELRTSSNYSTVSGLSAVSSSSICSPHSLHGYIVSGREFGLGSTPSIASYDNFGPYNDCTFSCGGADDFTLDFSPSKLIENGFFGK